MDPLERIKGVHDAKNILELKERYREWATEYETEIDNNFGYTGPQRTVDVATKYITKDSIILDAGAGTGLAGQLLYNQGYYELEALDMADEMLNEARKKNIYKKYHKGIMGESLELPDNFFDAIIVVGVFTYGHAPASSFDELIRVAKPGGYIIFTLPIDNYQDTDGFKQKMDSLEESDKWKIVERGEKFQMLPKVKPDFYKQVWVYKIN